MVRREILSFVECLLGLFDLTYNVAVFSHFFRMGHCEGFDIKNMTWICTEFPL